MQDATAQAGVAEALAKGRKARARAFADTAALLFGRGRRTDAR